MLSCAAILPHPPVMVPEVGGKEGLKTVEKTINAVLKVLIEVSAVQPEVIVIISPHGVVFHDALSIRVPKGGLLSGDFLGFGDRKDKFIFDHDLILGRELADLSFKEGISVMEVDNPKLDHGVLVPMFYVLKALKNRPRLLSINVSLRSYEDHYKFGQILAKVLNLDKRATMLLASADLSHALSKEAPNGYSPRAKKFDAHVLDLIAKDNVEHLLLTDPFLADEVGECGLRSIAVLLGAVFENGFKPRFHSYEAPYGVGYPVFGYF